jgi:hypothetical protein
MAWAHRCFVGVTELLLIRPPACPGLRRSPAGRQRAQQVAAGCGVVRVVRARDEGRWERGDSDASVTQPSVLYVCSASRNVQSINMWYQLPRVSGALSQQVPTVYGGRLYSVWSSSSNQ